MTTAQFCDLTQSRHGRRRVRCRTRATDARLLPFALLLYTDTRPGTWDAHADVAMQTRRHTWPP